MPPGPAPDRRDLLGLLAGVSDGRPGQGRSHPVAAVLALAAAAGSPGAPGTGSWLMERAAATGSLAGTGHGGDDPAPLILVRVDGKTVLGAKNSDGSQVHLLAALAGQPGVVAAGGTARHHRSHPLASRNMDRPFTILGLTS